MRILILFNLVVPWNIDLFEDQCVWLNMPEGMYSSIELAVFNASRIIPQAHMSLKIQSLVGTTHLLGNSAILLVNSLVSVRTSYITVGIQL